MKEIGTILVPVDFSENSVKVVDAALFFGQKCGAELHFLFVVQSFEDYSGFFIPHMPVTEFASELLQNAETKMAAYLQQHVPAAVRHRSKVVSGDVAEEIARYAEEQGVDLIVMGTHGYKGLEKVLFGSVAATMVKIAPCPVLTINPYKV